MSPQSTSPAGVKFSLPVSSHRPAPYSGPSREEVLALRREYLTPGLLTFYKDPLLVVEGHMQYVWDETGKQYLDAFAGIVTVSVGHCHPKVVEKVTEQLGKLQHTTTIYLHPTIGLYGKKMAEHMPAGSGLTSNYFTNSGSEANEIAVLMGREFTGNTDVISLRNGYHGGTQAAMALTAHGTWKFKSSPSVGVKNATPGYCYRCPYGLEYPRCDIKCARDIEQLIRYETSGEVACFIGEPIQGVGGVVTPPPEYFQIVYDIVRKHGGLCIADEVQTGFGRTGTKFWGFENWGVTPDIVTMAKGIGNGAPLGNCITRPEIAATMKSRIHFNTYGGNPISVTQGLATLEVIDAENIQQNALTVGNHLKDRLCELQQKHAIIGEVRGMGLMQALELVADPDTKTPDPRRAKRLLEAAREESLLIGVGGLYGHVIRIGPSLLISEDELAEAVARLERACARVDAA